MKLAFLDTTFGDYTPDTTRTAPLGGMQSAACYLAPALSRLGAEVTLVNGTSAPGLVDGVMCRHHATMPVSLLTRYDVLVVMGGCDSDSVRNLHAASDGRCRLLLWTQHAGDQPAVAGLADPDIAGLWDGFIFVSRWQREDFIRRFNLPRHRCHIARNAPAPCFAGLFAAEDRIIAAKPWPPVLAYTSTPFRGLDVLLAAMPLIRAAIPGTRLKVFSSLETYQVPLERDPYAALYERCRDTDGVDYIGSVSQPALAAGLRDVTALAYPNRYAETSCISVMEALAAGCLVVSSQLGALPETAAGFGRLLPVPSDPARHAAQFAEVMVTELRRYQEQPEGVERHLRAQVRHADAGQGWARQAPCWLSFLSDKASWQPPAQEVMDLLGQLKRPAMVNDHDAMADLCMRILSLDPAHAGVWRVLMQVQAAQARHADALLSLGRASRLETPDPAEWRDWMPSMLAGVASGADGAPLAARVAALRAVWPLLSGDVSWTALLAAAGRQLAAQARTGNDAVATLSACLLVAELTPDDAGIRIAAAIAAHTLGDHALTLELAAQVLRIDSAAILSARPMRAMLTGWLADAEKATLKDVEALATASAALLFNAMALVAGALGEDASLARQAVAAQTVPVRRALLLRMMAARHRLAGRRADQVELLRQAAALDNDPEAWRRLGAARLALSQRLLLENLGAVLNEGANGRLGSGWREQATALITQIESLLHLDGNDEGERSAMWGTLRGYDAFLAWFDAAGPGAPPLPAPPPGGRKLYDCFQFYNELDLLEIRLAELSPVVDHFVLVEAAYTHAGTPKPLYYAENRERFARYADKIIHVVVEDDPGGFAWVREAHQRQAILRGLTQAGPADMVVISDADEILRPEIASHLRSLGAEGPSLFAPHLDIHLYFLNLRSQEPWISVAAAPFDLVRQVGANNMRYVAKQGIGQTIPAAGWHFTWMGGIERFLAKLDAFAHREMIDSFGNDGDVNRARLEKFFATGRFEEGAIPGMWTALQRVPIDDGFPATLRARRAQFEEMGWIAPEGGA
jgi:glycosyltransferase involved in cell wall biosynthesis/tetratricopeptide (TPR) repeat protein